MNNMTEKIKDFLYDAMDYILIVLIIVVVTGIIGWRLDILFAEDVDKTPIEITQNHEQSTEDIESNESNTDQPNTENESKDTAAIEDSQENTDTDSTENEAVSSDTSDSDQPTERIFVVKIPKGALPPTIADILVKEGLIDSKSEFLSKAVEMKLDTRLQSGEFEIKENSSLETIIKIIARKK